MRPFPSRFVPLVCLLAAVTPNSLTAAEPAPLTVTAPKPRQVIQRAGFDSVAAATEKPGHSVFGYADVTVRCAPVEAPEGAVWEYRVTRLTDAIGRDVDWTKLDVRTGKAGPEATARVPAGGWYRLELRCRRSDSVTHHGTIEPVGVGEVFVVAGQSYATNCNDEKLTVADPQKRVVAFDTAKGTWDVANDPQPAPDGSKDGSI
jgi:hypothetical protein